MDVLMLRHSVFALMALFSLSSCGVEDHFFTTARDSSRFPRTLQEQQDSPAVESKGGPFAADEAPDPAGNCRAGKMKICHFPPGNPAAKHTLCVGRYGALNGHGVRMDGQPGGHGGDLLGDCNDEGGEEEGGGGPIGT
jgi:hypothetical protein